MAYMLFVFFQLEQKVTAWQNSRAAQKNEWLNHIPDWSEGVVSAVQYLCKDYAGQCFLIDYLNGGNCQAYVADSQWRGFLVNQINFSY